MTCSEQQTVIDGKAIPISELENNGQLESTEGLGWHGGANTDTDTVSRGKIEMLYVPHEEDIDASSIRVVSEKIVNHDNHAESVESSVVTTVDKLAFDARSNLHLEVDQVVSHLQPLQSEYSDGLKNDIGKDEEVEKPFESLTFGTVNPVHQLNGVDDSHVRDVRSEIDVSLDGSVSTVVSVSNDTQSVTDVKDKHPEGVPFDQEPERPPEEQESDNSMEQEAMPSFDEWKQKEQEKSKTADENTSSPASVLKPKAPGTKSINFASVTCGAKILAANPEAQNPLFMLMENRDMYMINPCKARKVFTIELCEPVQVQRIEIGNLELFSSLPQSIEVNISDRYPTKEWKVLGTFEARDERTIQAFPVEYNGIFSKYMRIEVLSHYGTEHYCPISILRVFGLAVDDEDDDDQNADTQEIVEEDSLSRETTSDDNPINLFSSATDTVLSLVKTVLSPKNDADKEEKESKHVASDQLAEVVSASNECTTVTCLSKLTTVGDQEYTLGDADPAQLPSNLFLLEGIQDTSLGDLDHRCSGEDAGAKACQEQPKPVDLVILVETPEIPLCELLYECEVCENGRNDSCLAGVCGYYQVIVPAKKSSCIDAFHLSKEFEQDEYRQPADSQSSCEAAHENTDSLKPLELDVVEIGTRVPPLLIDNLTLSSKDLNLSASVKPVSAKETDQHSSTESLLANTNPVENQQPTGHTKTVSEDAKLVEEAETPVVPPARAIMDDHHSASSSSGSVNGGRKVIYPESSSILETPVYDADTAGGSDDIAYQKHARTGKETLYGKLKNRMRNLELNLNLTNRYLEELSRRYKRQMEEMYTSLNRTITKLSNTAKVAEDKDQQQLERIIVLESKLANLTLIVDMVGARIESANNQLVERHLLLMAIELVVFIMIVMFITRRGIATELNAKPSGNLKPVPCKNSVSTASRNVEEIVSSLHEHALLTTSTPSKVSIVRRRSDSSHLERNRPLDYVSRSTEYSIIKSGSENDLSAIEQNIPIFLTTNVKDVLPSEYHKKQRKKKKGQIKVSSTTSRSSGEQLRTSVSSSTLVCGSQSSSVIYSASTNAVPECSAGIFNRHCRVRSLPIEDLSRNGHISSTYFDRGPQVSDHVSDMFKSQCPMPAIIRSASNKSATSDRQSSAFDFSAVNLINDEIFVSKGGERQFDANQQTVKLTCH